MNNIRRPFKQRIYCIYSGAFVEDTETNDEHVIPKSVGGNRSTVIRVAKTLNSRIATEIDAPVANDPMIMFGRRDAAKRGHSGKDPIPSWRGARSWKQGQPWGSGDKVYRVEFPAGSTQVLNEKTREILPQFVFGDTGFVIDNLKINNVARFKFALKTLLGVGWKLFDDRLLDGLDANLIRKILFNSVSFSGTPGEKGIGYIDEFMPNCSSQREKVEGLKKAIVTKGETSITATEVGGTLEWSVVCLGYLVGMVSIPISQPILGREVSGRALRLTVEQRLLRQTVVDRPDTARTQESG